MTLPIPSRFRGIIAFIDGLTEIGGIVAALSLLGILVLIASEIFARNVLGLSLHFSWDLAGYLMGACFLFGCAPALKGGSHVRVTALLEVLPVSTARVLERFACLVGLVICVVLAWALIDMAWLSGQRGSTAATAFRVPLVYPQAALAAGAVLLTMQCFAQLLRLLRGEMLATGPGLE
ncbi:TRAP transporter small permease [Aquamicrobium sp. LC103]|uniref:TRAP transporter small permease subunit n=1 Tax=Aquamicrobium sp. LC103 TaxID=1120658 RepID=UPI00063E7342|nr:TRAP transporter small permease [Aquamicrobium sp. LC103]TKT69590.1 TRAP transporter small permease [Aquamicrobium sp. LC103]